MLQVQAEVYTLPGQGGQQLRVEPNRHRASVIVRDDNAKLAELGYRSEFRRDFSSFEAVAFSISILSVIASVTSTFTFGIFNGGHVGLVFGWLIPCCFVAFVALSLAEMASSMPTSAGLYYFSAKMAPPKYAPLASWITGWANVIGLVTLVCGADYECAQMITTAIAVNSDGDILASNGATYGIFLGILFSHGIISSATTRVLGRLNIFYFFLNVGTTIAVIVALFVLSDGNSASTADAFTLFENNSGWSDVGAFMLAFSSPMWTLAGFDSATHLSEETANAARAAPLAILVSVAYTSVMGWLLLISVSFAIPSVNGLLEDDFSTFPIRQVFHRVLGRQGLLSVWSMIIIVQYVSVAALIVSASRVVFAFSRDNALPGSRFWKKLNSGTRTPVNAVWFVVVSASICGLLAFSDTAFQSLSSASITWFYISYATPIFLRITTGRSNFIPGPFSLGGWAVPVGTIAVAWVAYIVVILLFPPFPLLDPTVSVLEMNYAVVIVVGVFILALLSWVLSARHWFIGPVKTTNYTPSTSSTIRAMQELPGRDI